MATISDIQNRIKAIDLKIEIKTCIQNLKPDIIRLNKDQLMHGLDGDGKKIGPKYKNERYAIKKYIMNPLAGFGVPDLKFKGPFQKDFDMFTSISKFNIFSRDDKGVDLEKKYGPVLKLNSESKKKLVINNKKTFVNQVRAKIKL